MFLNANIHYILLITFPIQNLRSLSLIVKCDNKLEIQYAIKVLEMWLQ